jgi:hypothetical protein
MFVRLGLFDPEVCILQVSSLFIVLYDLVCVCLTAVCPSIPCPYSVRSFFCCHHRDSATSPVLHFSAVALQVACSVHSHLLDYGCDFRVVVHYYSIRTENHMLSWGSFFFLFIFVDVLSAQM